MSDWKSGRLRSWILGTAATAWLWNSIPSVGNAETPVASSKKKPGAKVVSEPLTSKPARVAVSTSGNSKKNSIQLVSQNVVADGDKSEVQRQLEALYQQDGREMPDMKFNLQPLNPGTTPGTAAGQQPASAATAAPPSAPATTKPVRSAQGYTQYQPKPPASPYPSQNYTSTPNQQAKPSQTVFGMFKKLTGKKQQTSSMTQAPVPPDFNTSVPGANSSIPTYNPNYNSESAQPGTIRYPEPARLSSQSSRPLSPATPPASKSITTTIAQKQTQGSVQSVAGFTSLTSPPLQQTAQLPPLSQQPTPLQISVQLQSLPPLSSEPQAQAPVGNTVTKRDNADPSPTGAVSDFPNPFTEVSENEADVQTGASPKITVSVSPKAVMSGVAKVKVTAAPSAEVKAAEQIPNVLPEQQEPMSNVESEPVRIDASESIEDPYAVEAKDFVESAIVERDESIVDPTAPTLENPETPAAPVFVQPKLVVEPATKGELPSNEVAADAAGVATEEINREKMHKIRERFGMKGLKGFCPVTLRDERELVDAKPEFHFVHRRQKFHFASELARDKFEANPLRYRPAAYGADVVALSRDKVVVEGTLEFAAWYKGRLFLFGSQENYDLFIKDPTQFATSEGIE